MAVVERAEREVVVEVGVPLGNNHISIDCLGKVLGLAKQPGCEESLAPVPGNLNFSEGLEVAHGISDGVSGLEGG